MRVEKEVTTEYLFRLSYEETRALFNEIGALNLDPKYKFLLELQKTLDW